MFCFFTSQAVAEVTNSQMNSITPLSTTSQQPPKPSVTVIKKPSSTSSPSKPLQPLPVKQPKRIAQHAEYLHPGILVFLNGKWEGSDHLLNVTNNIGVVISIIKPEDETLEVNDLQFQKDVAAIFSEANIKPQTLVAEGQAPLPLFEVEIFVYPIERGYVACCQGRLFESVILDRFKMDSSMAFQAITWEKQHLIVGPKSQFSDQLKKTVQEIAIAFTERFEDYEKLKRNTSLYEKIKKSASF